MTACWRGSPASFCWRTQPKRARRTRTTPGKSIFQRFHDDSAKTLGLNSVSRETVAMMKRPVCESFIRNRSCAQPEMCRGETGSLIHLLFPRLIFTSHLCAEHNKRSVWHSFYGTMAFISAPSAGWEHCCCF